MKTAGAEPLQPPLKKFLLKLPRVKTLKRDVDPEGGITRELLQNPQSTVWFRGFKDPSMVGNLWPSRAAVSEHFGVDARGLCDLLLDAIEHPVPPEVVQGGAAWMARTKKPDLLAWGIPKFYPEDAGRYLTAAIFSARWKGKRNLSYHRLWARNDDGGPARIVPRHLDKMISESRKEKKELPVALVIGAPIEVLLAAACSIDYATDEMDIASALRLKRTGQQLKVVELPSGARVPIEADIVMEGVVTLKDEEEGPFLDVLGTYDARRVQPVVRIDTVHTVEDPVLHVVLPGADEHFLLMGLPREPLMLRSIRSVAPGVKNVRLTEGGCGWLNGVVSIEKRREGDGKNAMMAAFSGHSSMKHVTVVDADIDIFNDREVEWAVATRLQADRGIVVVPGATGSSLDPSATKEGITTKWGIDATLPLGVPRGPFTKGVPAPAPRR